MKGGGVTVIAGTAVYTGTVQAVVVRVRQVLALVTQVTGTAEPMGPYNTSPHACYLDAVARVVHCALGGPNWVDTLIMVESVLTVRI